MGTPVRSGSPPFSNIRSTEESLVNDSPIGDDTLPLFATSLMELPTDQKPFLDHEEWEEIQAHLFFGHDTGLSSISNLSSTVKEEVSEEGEDSNSGVPVHPASLMDPVCLGSCLGEREVQEKMKVPQDGKGLCTLQR